MKAVIDRFEGDYAVLLFGEDEIKVDIPKVLLTPDVEEGSWLNVTFEVDHRSTRRQKEKIQILLERLKNKD